MQDLPEPAASFCRDELPQILIETLDVILEIHSTDAGECSRVRTMSTVLTRLVDRFGTLSEHKRACEILASIEKGTL